MADDNTSSSSRSKKPAKKSSSKSSAKKRPSAASSKKSASSGASGRSDRDAPRTESAPRTSPGRLAANAAQQLTELTGRHTEGVIGLEKND
jgi:hypothetical protein